MPQKPRGLGIEKEAARDVNEALVASLRDTILLRGIGESNGVTNAMLRVEGKQLTAQELTTPI